jgi:hypothetical protein
MEEFFKNLTAMTDQTHRNALAILGILEVIAKTHPEAKDELLRISENLKPKG